MRAFLGQYLWFILIISLLVLFVLNISIGSVWIPIEETWKILTGRSASHEAWTNIIMDFRLTKAVTCVLGGAALSLGGLLMQTLFRNPLAGPDVLGLSSGASLSVAILIMAGSIGFSIFSHTYSIAFVASLGAGSVFLLILWIAQRIRDNTSLLIIGLMVGAGTSSIVSVIQFLSRAEEQQYYVIWTMGSLGSMNWEEIGVMSIVTIVGSLLALSHIKSLNSWLLGDNYATSLGINIKQSRAVVIIATCLLTGVVTAFCGPIAFVGLAVPHLTRIVADTTNHRTLIPAVMLYGASLLLFCDIISQLPGMAMVIPINAITSLIGAPVVIWVIMRTKKIRV
jgi:iron complex transport system permease protein